MYCHRNFQINVYIGLDDRVTATSASVAHRFVFDGDGRVLGEYGASATAVTGETIWLAPHVANDNQFGGDDGVGGYAPLAVGTGTGAGAAMTWLHGNQLGVPIAFTDASGTAVAAPAYTLPGFPGQLKTSDIYYNRYRDYDSSTGRYIQADPTGLGGEANDYVYAEDNPLRFIDPLGWRAATAGEVAEVTWNWWWKRQIRPWRRNPIGLCIAVGEAIGVVSGAVSFLEIKSLMIAATNGSTTLHITITPSPVD